MEPQGQVAEKVLRSGRGEHSGFVIRQEPEAQISKKDTEAFTSVQFYVPLNFVGCLKQVYIPSLKVAMSQLRNSREIPSDGTCSCSFLYGQTKVLGLQHIKSSYNSPRDKARERLGSGPLGLPKNVPRGLRLYLSTSLACQEQVCSHTVEAHESRPHPTSTLIPILSSVHFFR